MRHPACLYRQAFRVLLLCLLIGSLLSACGRSTFNSASGLVASTAIADSIAMPVQRATITLDGAIEQITQERWLVGGTSVLLDAQTSITGSPSLGGSAHVRGVITADGAVQAQSITVDLLVQTTPAPASPTIAPRAIPTVAPTATPLPPGTVVNINGVIEQINITNNTTTMVVNSITYILPRNVVILLGKRLHVGKPIVFVGQVDVNGHIVVVNVKQIDNHLIIVNPPHQHKDHEDEDDEGDD